ncbi:hypothetical protein KP509_27G035300 [Ceratopteris richardii]|uniref:Uncharacterized protein n=1 Tax=Ceratopteris richardii TaxID=49495 RepID=A0A8T2RHF7_CERRI|nr:hypothetical protein KP509_27G035300 [Ceratopteris richardii]
MCAEVLAFHNYNLPLYVSQLAVSWSIDCVLVNVELIGCVLVNGESRMSWSIGCVLVNVESRICTSATNDFLIDYIVCCCIYLSYAMVKIDLKFRLFCYSVCKQRNTLLLSYVNRYSADVFFTFFEAQYIVIHSQSS